MKSQRNKGKKINLVNKRAVGKGDEVSHDAGIRKSPTMTSWVDATKRLFLMTENFARVRNVTRFTQWMRKDAA